MRANLFFAIIALAPILSLALESPIEGYAIHELQWKVRSAPDGDAIILNKTVQDVHAQLIKRNSNWKRDFAGVDINERLELSKRDKPDFPDYFCFGRWGACSSGAIQDGIEYLRGVPRQPVSGPGPSACGRVSCSYNSAIWWCNDNDHDLYLDAWSDVADGAWTIMNNCFMDPMNLYYTAGQAFSDGNWNVIVRSDTDNC